MRVLWPHLLQFSSMWCETQLLNIFLRPSTQFCVSPQIVCGTHAEKPHKSFVSCYKALQIEFTYVGTISNVLMVPSESPCP